MLLAIGSFLGVDIHLASMPYIMKYMHTTKHYMQFSISIFLLGLGTSILVYGPLSDKYGRKPIMLIGLISDILIIRVFGSTMAISADDIKSLFINFVLISSLFISKIALFFTYSNWFSILILLLRLHPVIIKLLQLNNPESEYLIEPIIIAKIEANINVLYIILSLLTIN